jgi:hypothetical protein
MTLGDMRENGVRSVAVCWPQPSGAQRHGWPDDIPVPAFVPRMVCTRCGTISADARPTGKGPPRHHQHKPAQLEQDRHQERPQQLEVIG